MKSWEARSLVRLTWHPDSLSEGNLQVARVEGAQLALASGPTLTFTLGDEARATSIGAHQKAFDVYLSGTAHVDPPLSVACHYQLRPCTAATWQLVEDAGSSYRAEVLRRRGDPPNARPHRSRHPLRAHRAPARRRCTARACAARACRRCCSRAGPRAAPPHIPRISLASRVYLGR